MEGVLNGVTLSSSTAGSLYVSSNGAGGGGNGRAPSDEARPQTEAGLNAANPNTSTGSCLLLPSVGEELLHIVSCTWDGLIQGPEGAAHSLLVRRGWFGGRQPLKG